MSSNSQNTLDKLQESFKILINQYLDTNIEEDNPLENLIKMITDKKNSDKITNIEKILFHLIENVNPLTPKFRLKLGIFLSLNALKYLKETKAKNAQANAEEVYGIFCHNLIELKEASIAEIFFKKEGEAINNMELYLELVINFITTNQIDLIINILKDKLAEKEVYLIKNTCTEHNKHYELFCSIFNINLCSNCKDEHKHYSQYGVTF